MSYLTEILTDSPALLLRLGEPSGTTAQDSTTNNRDGTISGTPALGLAGPCDDGTTAMAFDGADDWVELTDGADVDGVADFSIECWFKTGTLVETDSKFFWHHAGGAGYSLAVVTATGFLTFAIEHATVTTTTTTSADVDDGQWHHVVATRSGTNANIYVDGALAAGPITVPSDSLANTDVLRLGARSSGTRKFIGTAGNFAYYPTALSLARIAAHYAARLTIVPGDTPSYTALLASVAPAFVVLVEPQPMESLHTWTAAGGGLTNTWYASFLTQIATDVVAGGLYRRLDFVRQNATDLISRTTAALVNANLGSYFHETSTSRIYVSTLSGANPDTAALVGAWYTLFFSTSAVSFPDQPLYAPLVTGTLPTLSAEMPDPLFGATVSDMGEVSFLNGDGLFDRLSRQYVWRNKRVTIKLGGTALAYSDFATVATLRINAVNAGDALATLVLEDIGSILNQTLPLTSWDGVLSDPGNVSVPGSIGQPQPLCLGLVADCPMVCTERYVATADIWHVIDEVNNPLTILNNVVAVNRATQVRTGLFSPDDYTTDNVNTVSVLNSDYFYETHELFCTLGPATMPMTFGLAAHTILTWCGESDANIDNTAFAAADLAAPYVLGRFIKEPIIAADLMRELERSVNGQVYRGADGRWTCRVLDGSAPASYVSLSDADFASWTPESSLSTVLNQVRVRLSCRPYDDDWAEVSSSDDFVLYGSETSDAHRVDTWLTDEDDASALAQRLRFLSAEPPVRIAFEERGLTLMGASVGDLVAVTRARAPVARTGRYDGQLLRVVRLDKSLGPEHPRVTGVLDDLNGQTDRIARYVAAATTMTWANATNAERAVSGFYADADGYLDPADPLTHDAKVYA